MKLNKNTYQGYRTFPERIVQFGEGNFLRAFVDWMIDKMNREANFNSSVVVVQPIERGLIDKLNEQDGLYTLFLKGIKEGKATREHSIINCISRGINPYISYSEYLEVAENPELKFIISNTTEAGIAFDENDKIDNYPPKTFPGKLTVFLHHRFKTFDGDMDKGLILLPCELIDKNGEKLKETVIRFAKLWKLPREFIKWVEDANTFCNTLVDRIVTGYPNDRIEEILCELGYDDSMVVEGEQFHLWVIEGPKWLKDYLPVEKVGLNVLFVDDMTPYRTRKVRILNGAHTSMVPVAYLAGIQTVKESVEHNVIGKFIQEAIFNEIIPTLDLPKEELEYFANAVLERFKNPFIRHELINISLNSMSKYKTRVLPSVLKYQREKGVLPDKLVFSLAALIRFYKGERNGQPILLRDDKEILEFYKDLWDSYDGSVKYLEHIVSSVLRYEKLWGSDLNNVDGLKDKVTYYLINIEKEGIKKALYEVV